MKCKDSLSGEEFDVDPERDDIQSQIEEYLAEALCEGETVAYDVTTEASETTASRPRSGTTAREVSTALSDEFDRRRTGQAELERQENRERARHGRGRSSAAEANHGIG